MTTLRQETRRRPGDAFEYTADMDRAHHRTTTTPSRPLTSPRRPRTAAARRRARRARARGRVTRPRRPGTSRSAARAPSHPRSAPREVAQLADGRCRRAIRVATRGLGRRGEVPHLNHRWRPSTGPEVRSPPRRSRDRPACPTSPHASGRRSRHPTRPTRSSPRRSVSSSPKRQERTVPSAVIRVRSQAAQNDRVTEAMIPTVAGPPSTCHSSAGDDGSSSRPIGVRAKRDRARRAVRPRAPCCRAATRHRRRAASAR